MLLQAPGSPAKLRIRRKWKQSHYLDKRYLLSRPSWCSRQASLALWAFWSWLTWLSAKTRPASLTLLPIQTLAARLARSTLWTRWAWVASKTNGTLWTLLHVDVDVVCTCMYMYPMHCLYASSPSLQAVQAILVGQAFQLDPVWHVARG